MKAKTVILSALGICFLMLALVLALTVSAQGAPPAARLAPAGPAPSAAPARLGPDGEPLRPSSSASAPAPSVDLGQPGFRACYALWTMKVIDR
jgi:hypothetical protein